MKKILGALLLCAAAFAGFAAFSPTSGTAPEPPALPAQECGTQALFPGLRRSDIVSVSFSSSESQFAFDCKTANAVSVNGQKADSGVFSTLLSQILGQFYDPAEFSIDGESPLLSLHITTLTGSYIARFYSDGGRTTRIVTSTPNGAQTLSTDAWRIGTMLLTCEGTRILDKDGRETPAN